MASTSPSKTSGSSSGVHVPAADSPPDDSPLVNTLLRLQPPDEDEKMCFYYGLPSQPTLLGRTSSGIVGWEGWHAQHKKWEQDRNRSPWFQMRTKALGSVGQHAIRRCWASEVQPKIVDAIGHLPWSSIDVFRIGYVDMPQLEWPVVVWIGVDRKDTPWSDVAQALRACRRILDTAGLPDVDCQIRVSKVASLADASPRPPLLDPRLNTAETVRPLTTTIGQSICRMSTPNAMGSLGIFVRPARRHAENDKNDAKPPKERPLWAIACRHVGIEDELNKFHHRQHRNSSEQYTIGLPGEAVYQEMAEIAHDHVQTLSAYLDDHPADAKRRHELEQRKAMLDIITSFEPLESRKLGAVVLSPPMGLGLDPVPWTRDWCLMELCGDKFPEAGALTNLVYIDIPDRTRLALNRILDRGRRPGQRQQHLPLDGLMRIQGLVPLSEIRDPPGQERLVVGKYGATTGLTWGSPSELWSTVRSCTPDGHTTFVSQEWAIHGLAEQRTIPFSARGDSGAAVFCFDGRLAGFITKGTSPEEDRSVDITYATPAALVLADIEEKLGEKIEVI